MIKVVIVDDESWNREIVKTFGAWEQYGMEIVGEADDGLKAVQIIEETSPQIVITDMRMPGADGVKLLEILNDRFPAVKVIVVSGYDDFDYTKYAIRYKVADYLLKPVDPKELNAALQKCKEDWVTTDVEKRPLTLELELSFPLSSLKQLLRSHFNELNRDGIHAVFGQMLEELERNRISNPQLLRRVIEEMLLYLKELTADVSLERETLKASFSPDVLLSCEDTVVFLSQHYLQALEQIIQRRKYRNKLNLAEVMHYIDNHFSEPISLDSLAKVFFVSKEYLSKVFKQEYGRNVMEYILHLRMDKAMDWLADESIPIKTVAKWAGYEDVAYFYRVFKKHFGVAPGEMRKHGSV